MSTLQNSQSKSDVKFTVKKKYISWLPNQWTLSKGESVGVTGGLSKAVGMKLLRKGNYVPVRTNLLSTINFPNLFKGAGLKDYIVAVKDKKRELEDIRRGTINVGGAREPIICPINILEVSPLLEQEISTGESILEVDRTRREFHLVFRQDEEGMEKSVKFFYSELNGQPKCAEDDNENTMKFSFRSQGSEDVKVIDVQFSCRSQYVQLKKGFERYYNILTFHSGGYDKEMEEKLDDITYNRGGNKYGAGEFHKIPALSWKAPEIVAWLKKIPFQEGGTGRIMSLYEYIGKIMKYPANEKKTQRDPQGADFEQLSYDKLHLYFKNRDVGGKPEKLDSYLDHLFDNDEELYQTMQFEVKMMESNSAKKNEPYFNYNFHQVLKKMYAPHENAETVPSLTQLRNELLIEKRYLWSVMDNMDHFLSLMLFKEGVEDFIERKTRQFEEHNEATIEEFSVRNNEGWFVWFSKLQKFNHENHFILEEMSYKIRKEYEFFLTYIVKLYWLNKLVMMKKKYLPEEFLEEQVAMEKENNERNPADPILKYTHPMFHQMFVDINAEIKEKFGEKGNTLSAKNKKKVILGMFKPLNKEKKDRIKKKVKEEDTDEESKRKRFQEENEFVISSRRRMIIQKFLVRVMISYVRARMFDLGVKTVLSLLPGEQDLEKKDEEEETEGEEEEEGGGRPGKPGRPGKKKKRRKWGLRSIFCKTAAAAASKLAMQVRKHFGYVPDFARFGFCHAHVQIVNVCIHWFSNSLIFMTNLKNEAHQSDCIYREIIAMEAGCPTLVFKNLQSVYDQVLELSKFIVTCNTEYKYATFTIPIHKLLGGETKEKTKVNCQVVTQRLLKRLNYTQYDDIVNQYLEKFFEKFTKMNHKGEMRPKTLRNSRWIPLKLASGGYSEFGKLFVHEGKGTSYSCYYSFLMNRHLDYKEENNCVWDHKATPKRLYLNERKDVCELTNLLVGMDPKFSMKFPGVYQLLKGFDRAYQILRVNCENCVEKKEEDVEHPFGTSGDISVTKKVDSVGMFSASGEPMLEEGEDLHDVYLKHIEEEQRT